MSKINSNKKMKKKVKNMAKKVAEQKGSGGENKDIDFNKFYEFINNSGIMTQFKDIMESQAKESKNNTSPDEKMSDGEYTSEYTSGSDDEIDEKEIDQNEIDFESDEKEEVVI